MKKLLLLTLFFFTGLCSAVAQDWNGRLPSTITIKVGETIDLWTYYFFEGGTAVDEVIMAYEWDTTNPYFSLTPDGQRSAYVKGLKPTPTNPTSSQHVKVNSSGALFGWGETDIIVVPADEPVQKVVINSSLSKHECNVDDDLTSYLNSIVEVQPEAASDHSVTWSVESGNAVTISGKTIKAAKAGTSVLKVTSVSNPNASAKLTVLVHNPATKAVYAKETLNVDLSGTETDISDLLKQNISLRPNGFESVDKLTIESDKSTVVKISDVSYKNGIQLTAKALSEGTAHIEVTVYRHNYLKDYTDPGTTHWKKDVMSFRVQTHKVAVTSLEKTGPATVECNVGDESELTSYLNSIIKVLPENATDKSLTWTVTDGKDRVTVSKSTIKAVKDGPATLKATSVDNNKATATVKMKVYNPATDVKFKKNTLDVDYFGSETEIGDQLKNNISFTPSEQIGKLTIESDKSNVVRINDLSYDAGIKSLSASAVGTGTATITVTLYKREYLKSYTSGSTQYTKMAQKTFTVNVKKGVIAVTDVSINSSLSSHECNVGDDLTSYLNSLVVVSPSNATDKSVKWGYPNDSNVPIDPAVKISSAGKITAVKEGTSVLEVYSVSDPSKYARVRVNVDNPYTDFTFSQSTLNYTYNGSSEDISEDLGNNILMLPSTADGTHNSGFKVTSSNSAVVKIFDTYLESYPNIEGSVVGIGDATITVTLKYTDYLATYQSGSTVSKTVEKSFKVHVDQAANISFVGDDIPCIVGDDLTQFLEGRLRYQPENLSNKAHTWKVVSGDAVSVTNSGKTVKAVKSGTAKIRATLTGYTEKSVDVTIKVSNPATDVTVNKDVIEVTYSGSGKVDISDQLKANINLLPQNYEYFDGLTVSSSNQKVLQKGFLEGNTNKYQLGEYQVLATGESTVTVELTCIDLLKKYDDYPVSEFNKTVKKTFKVVVKAATTPVTAVNNTSSRTAEECNVGDDLTTHLNSLIQVLPANATDKTYKWSVTSGNAVTVSGNTIKAAKAGTAVLKAASVSNPDVAATVTVKVHNPATDVSFANSTVTYEYKGSSFDVSSQLLSNITFLPAGYDSMGPLAVTSTRPDDVLNVNVTSAAGTIPPKLSAMVLGVGSTTVTVTFSYIDYLAKYAGKQESQYTKTVQKSFTVKVNLGTIDVTAVNNTSSRTAEECNVGDDLTTHLNSLIQVLPDNASNKTYKWSVTSGNAVTVSGNTIKAAKAGTAVLKAASVSNPDVAATVTVKVHNPATDIQINNKTVNVAYKGKAVDISSQLKQNISFLPSGFESVSGLTVTSDKPALVSVTDAAYGSSGLTLKASALGEGKATITVGITWNDYLADYTTPKGAPHTKKATKSFTVEVLTTEIPVESLTIVNDQNKMECNVGDDLSAFLNSIIKVLPENATDKTYNWSVTSGSAVTVSGTTIKAVKAGTAVVKATSVENPKATASITIEVHNPATDIQFASQTVKVSYKSEAIDISDQLRQNISFLPSGFESVSDLTVTSDKPALVSVTDAAYGKNGLTLKAKALSEGKATITVGISWSDHLADYTTPKGAPHKKTVTKSFTVDVVTTEVPVTGIAIDSQLAKHDCTVGDDLTTYINNMVRVSPDNATDKTYKWSVTQGDAVTVSGTTVKAVKAGTAVLTVTSVNNPKATAKMTIEVHNPARDIQIASQSLSVTYKDAAVDISDQLKQNITLLPKGYDEIESISVTSSAESIVRVSDVSGTKDITLKAEALAEGTATITVKLNYTDYLGQLTNPKGQNKHTVTKTFTVNVVTAEVPVTGITIVGQDNIDCTVGDDLTAYLSSVIEVSPEDATDKTYKWSVTQGDAVSVSGTTVKAVKAGTAVLTVTSVNNPKATAKMTIVVHNPATDIQIASQSLNVTYKDAAVDISDQLKQNITLLPKGYDEIESISVTSSDESIVRVSDVSGTKAITLKAEALAEGTATITVTLNYTDYLGQLTNPKGQNKHTVTKTFTVGVVTTEVPVSGLTIIGQDNVDCTVGDDLTAYLSSVIEVSPENATDKTYTWSIIQGDAVSLTGTSVKAVKAGTAMIMATSVNNPDAVATFTIVVHHPANDIRIARQTLTVIRKGETVDISDLLKQNITLLPEDYDEIESFSVASSDESIVRVWDVNGTKDITLKAEALAEGTATITVTLDYTDYLGQLINPNGESKKTVTKTFTVEVVKDELDMVQAFEVSIDEMAFGKTGQLRLTPIPANAKVPELTLQITGQMENAAWNAVNIEQDTDDPLVYNITPSAPQRYQLAIGDYPLYKAGTTEVFTYFDVGAALDLHEGWYWRTNCYGNVSGDAFQQVFGGNDLIEIRTQEDLLYNDPKWGYYGVLMEIGLPQAMPYKVRMNSDHQSILWNGQALKPVEVTIYDGWTWLPSPYCYDRLLTNVFDKNQLEEGMAIVSKESGWAEYDGSAWYGDLTVLPAGESFLFYCPTFEEKTLSFRKEALMSPGNENDTDTEKITSRAMSAVSSAFGFQPDVARRFMDNMTMVARLGDVASPADYAVGAFVDGECRGEARCQSDGRVFITIHCDGGERVMFRLCHIATGRQYDITEMLTAQRRVGSLRNPVVFHSPGVASGIYNIENTSPMARPYAYDLNGRKVDSQRKGVTIIRLSDGTVRKVMK